ncbi:MAG: EamA family transporter [Burkholderiales bacterium]|nr:MAG: EamA family transporter [Burkholderiales bacterium]
MFAFAANSLLCRLALEQPSIDPATFGTIRLASGALMLAFIVRLRPDRKPPPRTDWLAAAMLFAYVAFFSFAYLGLPAGSGALILFGAVQLTMLGAGLRAGERFAPAAWAGLSAAIAGLVYLVSPGIAAPAPLGAALMAAAGVAWGIYSLRGRGVTDPLGITAANFVRAVPLAVALNLVRAADVHADGVGVALAIASGAVSSGIGYAIWYAALRGLSAMRAATVQLSVPPIAAIGGALWLSEPLTVRLLLASAAILGGIAVVLATRARAAGRAQAPSR